jgi:hypothetical protein
MRCISTHAVMDNGNPELVEARRRLSLRLTEIKAGMEDAEDSQAALAPIWAESEWSYVCSMPRREDDGAITYLHLFRHPATLEGRRLSLGVIASPGWWPIGCASLAPFRSQARGSLRLVS